MNTYREINIFMYNHKFIWMCMYIYGVSGVSAIRQSSVMMAKQAATHSDASTPTLSSKPLIGHHDLGCKLSGQLGCELSAQLGCELTGQLGCELSGQLGCGQSLQR